jgi:hypothetical protein
LKRKGKRSVTYRLPFLFKLVKTWWPKHVVVVINSIPLIQ